MHCSTWVKRDQLDVTCFIISLFNAQHVSDVNSSILRSLRPICWVISWVVLFWFDVCWCYVAVWLGWCVIRMQAEALVPLVPQPAYGYLTWQRVMWFRNSLHLRQNWNVGVWTQHLYQEQSNFKLYLNYTLTVF